MVTIDEEVRRAGISVKRRADASAVGHRERSDLADVRAVDMSVHHLLRLTGFICRDQDVVFGVGQGRAPQISGARVKQHEVVLPVLSGQAAEPVDALVSDQVACGRRVILEQWETLQLQPQDFIVAGDDVVVPLRLVGVGKQSGVETTANAAHVWTFRNEKIIRQTTFQTLAEALEAVGLRE